MAETTEHGSNSWLAFVVGALLVGILVLGYMMFMGGGLPGTNTQRHELDLRVETPNLPTPNLPAPTPAPAPAAPAQ